MKIVICWPTISGYMAACWRELSHRKNIELFILAYQSGAQNNTSFSQTIMNGINCRLLNETEYRDARLIHTIVFEQKPDVIVISGWDHPPYTQLAFEKELKNVWLIMMMDNSRKYNLRQMFARLKIGAYLDRMNRVFVAGERSWQLAKYLNIPEYKIFRGTYGIDYQKFFPLFNRRLSLSSGWPGRFLFIGQYIERKGIDILIHAYQSYRKQVSEPWSMTCCGQGELSKLMESVPGVENSGFVQPDRIDDILLNSGVFVMPSRFDAWGVAIAEACASGLPVICSEACGASVDVVSSYFNGIVVPTGDVDALAKSFRWMHERYDKLGEMGLRSTWLAAPYAAEFWADRIIEACSEKMI